jgi:hypothetical protein
MFWRRGVGAVERGGLETVEGQPSVSSNLTPPFQLVDPKRAYSSVVEREQ